MHSQRTFCKRRMHYIPWNLYKMINTKPDDQMQCYYLFTFGILLNRALCLECKGRESPKFFKCKVSWERVSTRSDQLVSYVLSTDKVPGLLWAHLGSDPSSISSEIAVTMYAVLSWVVYTLRNVEKFTISITKRLNCMPIEPFSTVK